MHIDGFEINPLGLIPLTIAIVIAILAIRWLRGPTVTEPKWRTVTWILTAGFALAVASIFLPTSSVFPDAFTVTLIFLVGFKAYGYSRGWTLRPRKTQAAVREHL